METIRDQNVDFLFRVPNGFISELARMPMAEFDTDISFTIVTKQTKETKHLFAEGKVKILPGPSKFGKRKKDVSWFHPSPYLMKLRVVRFQLETGEYETLVTSLDRNHFPIAKLKELYHMCGHRDVLQMAEVLHRAYELPLAEGGVYQAGNLCTSPHVQLLRPHRELGDCRTIGGDKVNFSQTIHICFSFLKKSLDIDIRELIHRYVEPVRPGRSDKWKLRPKSVICFNYRVA